MDGIRIKIEERFSKIKYNLFVCLFAFLTILVIAAIFLYGYNWITQFLFLFILGIDIFIPVILPPILKGKYLSEIQITRDFIVLIFKEQDKVVERIEIAKADIVSVKIDVEIERGQYQKNPLCQVNLYVIIKLLDGRIVTNCKIRNSKQKELFEKWIEEKKARITDRKELERFLNTMEKSIETLTCSPQFIETRNYSFIFDFITCEQFLPNCILNIKTNNFKIKKEIEYYKKYERRMSK